MMETGIARKIDDLGRIVIPAETRRLFNIREGDHLFISVEGGSIVLRKMTDTCTFCGSETRITQFKGRGVCSSCRSQLRS
ncbi:MAG: AbrB/MazE/SpoVT family DNA-binding domain-containing protein [Actinomycetota bacterium]|nr:AbrB/MazE/SpoVT family DNA-binding domain-containing protein [Actinomycetota bacterium]